MKSITLPVAELRSALAGFGKVIPKRTTLPVLSSVRVRRHESGQLDLTVTDLDRFATFRLATLDPAGAADILIPFEDLSNVVKSCGSTDTITLESSEETAASIRFPVGGQTMEHHCETVASVQFPALPDLEGAYVTIPDALRIAIQEAMECASSDPTRYVLNGAFLDVSAPKAHYVVGTNGKHLFSSNSFSLPLTASFVIPEHKFLNWKGFSQDGPWKLRAPLAGDKTVPRFELISDRWNFVSRTIDGAYPKWKEILPSVSSYQTSVSIDSMKMEEVLQAAQRLPIFEDKYHTVGLEVAGSAFRLLGKSKPEMPWTKIDMPEVTTNGPDVTIFLDKRYLLKALRFGLNRIEFIDEISSMRFSQAGRQMIVMPVRASNNPSQAQHSPAPAEVPAAAQTNSPPSVEPPKQTKPMSEHTTNGHSYSAGANGSISATSTPPAKEETKSSLETSLVQIESIKTGFRETINNLTKLGDSIRQAMREQKATDKEVQTVRQTLRSLQGVRL